MADPYIKIRHPHKDEMHLPNSFVVLGRGIGLDPAAMEAWIENDAAGTSVQGELRLFVKKGNLIRWMFMFRNPGVEGWCRLKIRGKDEAGEDVHSDPRTLRIFLNPPRRGRAAPTGGFHSDPTIDYPDEDPYTVEPAERDYFVAYGYIDANRNVYDVTVDSQHGYHDEDGEFWMATFDPLSPGERQLTIADSLNGQKSITLEISGGQ